MSTKTHPQDSTLRRVSFLIAAITWLSSPSLSHSKNAGKNDTIPSTGSSSGSSAPTGSPNTQPTQYNTFIPSIHGLNFINSFNTSHFADKLNMDRWREKFDDKLLKLVPDEIAFARGYGLCGGMSFVALDFFHAKRPIPTDTAVPAPETPLFKYIFARQLDSFGTGYAETSKFRFRMEYQDEAVEYMTGTEELPNILSKTTPQNPVVIGMVNVDREGKPWDNHQVVAHKVTRINATTSHVWLYDPNYPNHDNIYFEIKTRSVVFKDLPLGVRTLIQTRKVTGRNANVTLAKVLQKWTDPTSNTSGTIKPVRGIFIMPYTKKNPPSL
ncbi:hypothetical protein FEM03_21895 [Phragmitibacter flavus]|uniref:Uncharacterized protein n=1 Tax=Phragmitibacter flavus TaxID=2576071 RepID=A0A5R8K897_9BACT|nr:hypothetical protein [Phragmitibacter flavus]TLD68574.1 hypothetical protein FEM03_21895 [Phragmitibacter flavus]